MPLYEPFHQRQRRLAQGDQPVVWQYDDLPEAFREQVIHIWQRALGRADYMPSNGIYRRDNPYWSKLQAQVAEDLGLGTLGHSHHGPYEQCRSFLLSARVPEALTLVERSFRMIAARGPTSATRGPNELAITQVPDDAISTLNQRFRDHAIGYQFTDGLLVRVDSEFVHAEMVEPAITLLHRVGFSGPNDEFLRAHEHYRHGRHKEALVEANKAFESTMKAICDARNWSYPAGAPAQKLITVVLREELVPVYMQSQLTQLAGVLEALPTVRNKEGGHGQGSVPVTIPDYLTAYGLHLAAANIVFLVKAHTTKP